MPTIKKENRLRDFKTAERLMGNRFELTVVGYNESWAKEKIERVITGISLYKNCLQLLMTIVKPTR